MQKKVLHRILSLMLSLGFLFNGNTSVLAQSCMQECLAQGNDPHICNDLPQCPDCVPGAGINLSSCLKLSDDSLIRDKYSNASSLINLIVQNLFVFAGVILFFFVILAGYKFILGGKKGIEEARTLIATALTGFLIMFSAYWIVQLIKIITGADIPI